MKNLDTPTTLTLEQRITAALASTEITSTDLEILLQETENTLSDTAIKIERERAFDLTKSPDAVAAHRAMTEAEFTRNRLRLVLPELQQKFEAVRAQEQVADWEIEYHRIEVLRDAAAEKWARMPKIIDEIIELFRWAEAVDEECSRVNRSALASEHRRLVGPELKARGLQAFSRASPPMAKVTTLRHPTHE